MNDQDMDRLLERGFSGDPPGEAFRNRVLRASTAALVHVRQRHVWRRYAPLSAAAVFIAAVSFLLGRCSAPSLAIPPTLAGTSDTVTVPGELVAWLDTARLFKQLGMEDRMSRALDRAANLLPPDAAAAGAGTGQTFAADTEPTDSHGPDADPDAAPPHRPAESINRILAQSLGGYDYESGMD